MRHLSIIFLIVFIVGCAGTTHKGSSSAEVPSSELFEQSYGSEAEAVTAAGREFLSDSIRRNVQYLGGIHTDGEQFYFSYSSGDSNRSTVTARIPTFDMEIVAIWLTHGGYEIGGSKAKRSVFFPSDVRLANEYGVQVYLVNERREIRKYSPGDPVRTDLILPGESTKGFADGELVGNIGL